MNMQQFLLALKGRLWIFLLLLGATVAAAVVVTLAVPKRYDASVSLLIDNRDEQSLTGTLPSARDRTGFIQTQIDIINSQRVARRVVDNLKLAENPDALAAFAASGAPGAIEDWIASGLLAGLKVACVHNPDFALGLSTSLKAGLAAVPATVDGAIVCLGDMPHVDAALIDKLVTAFDPERGALVVVPTIAGKRGNPVVWSRRFFADLSTLEGDVGARHLIGRYPEAVVEVPVSDKAALVDVDTPEALIAVKAEIEGA